MEENSDFEDKSVEFIGETLPDITFQTVLKEL